MRIVFMGTPAFAVPPLRALIAAGHDIAAVVTRIDKPAGRGKVLTAPAVKVAAEAAGIPVLQPRRVRETGSLEQLRALAPEAIVVAAYGQILPQELLSLPARGCINIHASLLPAYRGAAPINWAIINGEQRTGITIMQMDAGMDTGAILLQDSIPIADDDTAGSLAAKLSALGSSLIIDALNRLGTGTLSATAQDNSRASLAPLLAKEDGLIDWRESAGKIRNRVRGLSPWPGAYAFLDGKLIKVIESAVIDVSGEPGKLIVPAAGRLAVGTGDGLLEILSLQPEGKRPMAAPEFLRGHRELVGKSFKGTR
jgi:methionyl-tRNA formyltransferase